MVPSLIRFRRCRSLAAMALLVAASTAQAQSAPAPAPASASAPRADPLDAQARVPAVAHRSALATYRRLGEDKPVPWKEANDTVTRIGGWRTYTREAQQPDPPASAPAQGGHHQHHHAGGAKR